MSYTFDRLPFHTFPQYPNPADTLPDPGAVTWRLETEQSSWDSYKRRFTELVELEKVRALSLGRPWYHDECRDPTGADWLIELSSRLTGLEALYLGHLEAEHLSRIYQSDLSNLLETFPGLKKLVVYGDRRLRFPSTGHRELRDLCVDSAGISPEVARGIAAAPLPSLERLELWLGDEESGGTTAEDLAPLFAGEGKPALRHLGLVNSFVADELAAALASAPVVAQLTSLDLSCGNLSDTGAEALLRGQPLSHLEELDLRHHFLSEAMMLRLWTELEPAGVRVNLFDQQEAEDAEVDWWDGRYIAVTE